MLERIEGPKKNHYQVASDFNSHLRKYPKTSSVSSPQRTKSPLRPLNESPVKRGRLWSAEQSRPNTPTTPRAQTAQKSPAPPKAAVRKLSKPVKREIIKDEFYFDEIKENQIPPHAKFTVPPMKTHQFSTPAAKDLKVQVAVRVRPFTAKEEGGGMAGLTISDGLVLAKEKEFSFNQIFSEDSEQTDVFRVLAEPQIESLLEGYNTSLFGYGQTGSGKTFTMMGTDEDPGIIPRFYEKVLLQLTELSDSKMISAFSVEIAFFEIYNERIYDLLVEEQKRPRQKEAFSFGPRAKYIRPSLKVRGTADQVFVEGLTWHQITNQSEADEWVRIGNSKRATASTGMNDQSSRSHSIFQIRLQINSNDNSVQRSIKCVASLVDLAGSERSSTAQTSGRRLKEGNAINQSLLTLGKVIKVLSSGGKHIPYRESLLTHILKHSLGGNSQTAIIASVSPAIENQAETMSTLKYASLASQIQNKAVINEEQKAKTIRELQAEIDQWRAINNARSNSDLVKKELEAEIVRIKKDQEREKEEWLIQQKEDQERYAQALEKKVYRNSNPHLINVSKDPSLTGLDVHLLPEGITVVGTDYSCAEVCDDSAGIIILQGSMMMPTHALIRNDGIIQITPVGSSLTSVNGKKISGDHQLSSGDRIIFGQNHFFIFRDPNSRSTQPVTDFDKMSHEFMENQKREQKMMLERKKLEFEKEKSEIRQMYSEAFDCSIHSVNDDPDFLELLNVVVSYISSYPCLNLHV